MQFKDGDIILFNDCADEMWLRKHGAWFSSSYRKEDSAMITVMKTNSYRLYREVNLG